MYVARVGSAQLTEEDLQRTLDTLGVGGRGKRDIVNEWIINELLYQEAVRRGLADGDQVRRQLEATRKHLAVAALLEEELYLPGDTSGITGERVEEYLKNSPGEYTLRDDVALTSFVLCADRESASAIRSMLLDGASWGETLSHAGADTSLAPKLKRAAIRQYFTEGTLYPQELWKLARVLRKNEVSYVVTTDAGFAVMSVHDIRRQGETPPSEYVRQEIRDRILIAHRQAKYESLVTRLRSRSTVELRLAGADTVGLQ
jgi:hypothetical protein